MRGVYPFILSAALVMTAFFLWIRRRIGRRHAQFKRVDVEEALQAIVSERTFSRDAWERFLRWPIDDPHLESVRQSCRHVVADFPPTRVTEIIGKEELERLREIHRELQGTPSR